MIRSTSLYPLEVCWPLLTSLSYQVETLLLKTRAVRNTIGDHKVTFHSTMAYFARRYLSSETAASIKDDFPALRAHGEDFLLLHRPPGCISRVGAGSGSAASSPAFPRAMADRRLGWRKYRKWGAALWSSTSTSVSYRHSTGWAQSRVLEWNKFMEQHKSQRRSP